MSTYPSYHLEHKRITLAHWISLPLMITIIAIGGYRILAKQLRSRLDIMPLSIAAKSIFFLIYMMISAHYNRKNLKACMVLNFIEPIGWFAAVILPIIGMAKGCSLTGCILSGILVGLSLFLFLMSLPVAWYSWNQWRYFKRTGKHPRESSGFEMSHVPSTSSSEAGLSRKQYHV